MFKKFFLFQKFKPRKWKKYSFDKRLEVIQKIENFYAKKQKRKPVEVVPRNDFVSTLYGSASYVNQIIFINSSLLTDSSKQFLLLSTILHEGRHIYQSDVVNKSYNDGRIPRFSKAYSWMNSSDGYISYEENKDNYVDYANQSVELDANSYALKQLKKLKRKFKNDVNYQAEIINLTNWFENAKTEGRKKYGFFYKFKIRRKNKKQRKLNKF